MDSGRSQHAGACLPGPQPQAVPAMTRRARILFAVTLAGAALGVALPLAHAEDTTAARAQVVLSPFKRALKQALTEGMREGPVPAIAACNTRAPELAESHSRSGVTVGRSSHRLRSAANAAPDWVRPILNAYVSDAATRAPKSVALGAGRSGYVEPILVQPLCLTCHGKALAPEVAARIAALYPDDRATGFEVGDLRGVWWVELPAEP